MLIRVIYTSFPSRHNGVRSCKVDQMYELLLIRVPGERRKFLGKLGPLSTVTWTRLRGTTISHRPCFYYYHFYSFFLYFFFFFCYYFLLPFRGFFGCRHTHTHRHTHTDTLTTWCGQGMWVFSFTSLFTSSFCPHIPHSLKKWTAVEYTCFNHFDRNPYQSQPFVNHQANLTDLITAKMIGCQLEHEMAEIINKSKWNQATSKGKSVERRGLFISIGGKRFFRVLITNCWLKYLTDQRHK